MGEDNSNQLSEKDIRNREQIKLQYYNMLNDDVLQRDNFVKNFFVSIVILYFGFIYTFILEFLRGDIKFSSKSYCAISENIILEIDHFFEHIYGSLVFLCLVFLTIILFKIYRLSTTTVFQDPGLIEKISKDKLSDLSRLNFIKLYVANNNDSMLENTETIKKVIISLLVLFSLPILVIIIFNYLT